MYKLRIVLSLTESEAQRLIALAEKEYRQPRDQAVKIIADKLREFESKDSESEQGRNPN